MVYIINDIDNCVCDVLVRIRLSSLKSSTWLHILAKRISWEIYVQQDVVRGTSPNRN